MREIHTLRDLISFYRAIPEYLSAESESEKAATYRHVIIAVSGFLGLLALLAGIALFAFILADEKARADLAAEPKAIVIMLVAPLILGVIGCFLGVALTCTFAPNAFLSSPAGAKWMRLIGVQSILAARIVCVVVATILIAVPLFLALTMK